MNKPNHDPHTNLAFGLIAASVLDFDQVDRMLYGNQITNHSYQLQKAEAVLRAKREVLMNGREFTQDDEDAAVESFAERYESDEDYITGELGGVSYATSWFGGALHFFITKSPYTRGCRPCSPCAPGAGDLHSEGTLLTYNVPPGWRA